MLTWKAEHGIGGLTPRIASCCWEARQDDEERNDGAGGSGDDAPGGRTPEAKSPLQLKIAYDKTASFRASQESRRLQSLNLQKKGSQK